MRRLPQVREPAAHRVVQDPRRLHQAVVAGRAAARRRRDRAVGRQPRPGGRLRGPIGRRAGHRLHARRRVAGEGRRHRGLRRPRGAGRRQRRRRARGGDAPRPPKRRYAGAPVRRPGRDRRPGHGRAGDPGGRARCGHGGGAAGRRRPAVGGRQRRQGPASPGARDRRRGGRLRPVRQLAREGRRSSRVHQTTTIADGIAVKRPGEVTFRSSASSWTTSSPSPTPRSARASCTWWSAEDGGRGGRRRRAGGGAGRPRDAAARWLRCCREATSTRRC